MPIFRGRRDLLTAFRKGERAALETVYRAYVDRVTSIVGFAFRRAGPVGGLGGHPADLEDAVQEVFLKAFSRTARQSFDELRDFGPYLWAIARNTLFERGRRYGRELLLPQENVEQVAVGAGSEFVVDAETQWQDQHLAALANAYVRGLPDELRRVYQACYVEGLSQRDAAEKMGIGRQVVRTLDARLRDGLREQLRLPASALGGTDAHQVVGESRNNK